MTTQNSKLPEGLVKYQQLIKKYQRNLWKPPDKPNNFTYVRAPRQKPKDVKEDIFKSYKVNLFLNETQRSKLLDVMKRTTTMYNYTVKFLRKFRKDPEYKEMLKYEKLYHKINDFKQKLALKYNVDIHILNAAVKHALTAFKSAEANLENGYISHFKVKCLKQNRNNRIIEIDRARFKKPSIIGSIFTKEVLCELESKIPFNTILINSSCFIRYSKQKNKFQLFINQNMSTVPKTVHYGKKSKKIADNFTFECRTLKQYKDAEKRFTLHENKLVLKEQPIQKPIYKFSSLDPGLKTFMTCLTNKDTSFYGADSYNRVKELLGKIYTMNEKQTDTRKDGSIKTITNRMKRNYAKRIERRIKGIIDDLHWQTANELTNKSQEVIIGNMSAKSIVEGDTFDHTSKQAVLRMRFYQFRQRLKYKCLTKNRTYICVHEGYTSRTCSVCANYKPELELSDRVYNCDNCHVSMDRDLNACRGIWIKSMDRANFRNN